MNLSRRRAAVAVLAASPLLAVAVIGAADASTTLIHQSGRAATTYSHNASAAEKANTKFTNITLTRNSNRTLNITWYVPATSPAPTDGVYEYHLVLATANDSSSTTFTVQRYGGRTPDWRGANAIGPGGRPASVGPCGAGRTSSRVGTLVVSAHAVAWDNIPATCFPAGRRYQYDWNTMFTFLHPNHRGNPYTQSDSAPSKTPIVVR